MCTQKTLRGYMLEFQYFITFVRRCNCDQSDGVHSIVHVISPKTTATDVIFSYIYITTAKTGGQNDGRYSSSGYTATHSLSVFLEYGTYTLEMLPMKPTKLVFCGMLFYVYQHRRRRLNLNSIDRNRERRNPVASWPSSSQAGRRSPTFFLLLSFLLHYQFNRENYRFNSG